MLINFTCKKCGYIMNAQECLQYPDAVPSEGDLSICLNCAAVSELRAGIWHLLSDEAISKLSPNTKKELEALRISIRTVVNEDLAFNQKFRKPN